MSTSKRRAPRRVHQPLSEHEEGAHLYATFWGHVKAALASLIPFGILYFIMQPLEDALGLLQSGGFTLVPGIIAIYACAWAGGSVLLLHWRRFDETVWHHYATWALAGAVALPLAALSLLALVRLANEGTADFWNAQNFVPIAAWSPVLGAAGAAIGRWALTPSISWYRWLERPPLPNALEFVEGKHDRDEFGRM